MARKPPPTQQKITPEKIAWWCLHAIVFLVPIAIANVTYLKGILPFLDLPITYDQFDIVKVFTMRFFALIGIAAFAWDRFNNGGTLRRSKLDWLILAFLGWVVLTTVTSIHPETAVLGKYRRFEGLLSFFTYAAVYFLVVQLVDKPAKIRALARSLVLGGFIVSLYGLAQAAGIDAIRWGTLPFEANRSFSTFGNPDLLGGYLIFPLPIALALALTEKETRWRAFYWVAFVAAGLCLVTSFVRGAWIGGFVGLVVLIVVAWRKKPELETMDKGFIGAAGAGLAAVVAWSLQQPGNVMNIAERITSILQFNEGSALTRFQIWDAAWSAIVDSPIVGHGADTFRLLFPIYKPIEYVESAGYLSVADNVHNYPLQAATGLGIPGVIALYAIFIWALIAAARAALGKDGGSKLLLAGVWCAALAYLVHLMFGLSVTGSTVFLWVCVGVLMAPRASVKELKASQSVWPVVAAVAIVLVATWGQYWNVRMMVADRNHLESKIGVLTTEGRIQASARSIELNPLNDMYRAELGLAYTELAIKHINQAESLAAQGIDNSSSVRDANGAFLLAEQALLDVIEFVPPEYDNYVFLSNLYNLAGLYIDERYLEDAVEIADRGIEVEEYGPAIRVQKGRALVAMARHEEALPDLEFAAEMDSNYAEPRVLLAQAYSELGRYDDAIAVLEHVLERQPDHQAALDAMSRVEMQMAADGVVR